MVSSHTAKPLKWSHFLCSPCSHTWRLVRVLALLASLLHSASSRLVVNSSSPSPAPAAPPDGSCLLPWRLKRSCPAAGTRKRPDAAEQNRHTWRGQHNFGVTCMMSYSYVTRQC